VTVDEKGNKDSWKEYMEIVVVAVVILGDYCSANFKNL